MPLIDVDDVQPWLESTKLRLDHDDALLEEPFWSDFVKSRLSGCGMDVALWVDGLTTPSLVKSVIGICVAAQKYSVAYSESEDGGIPYATKLEELAYSLLEGICAGTLDLQDATDDPATTGFGSVLFYPTDATGALDPEQANKFAMGKTF